MVIKFVDKSVEEIEELVKVNSKKTVKNVFSMFAPESFVNEILKVNLIDANKQAAQLKKTEKEVLIASLLYFNVKAVSRVKDSEIVTAGGIDLKEVNSKTMQSKIIDGLYFCGEVLNIDAYTGGFNLQSCWSTAYIVSQSFN